MADAQQAPQFPLTTLRKGATWVELADTSRFKGVPLYGRGLGLHYGTPSSTALRLLKAQTTPYVIPLACDRRPDFVAYATYSDPRLWWVLCTVNDMLHPAFDFLAGKEILLPTPASVTAYLNSKERAHSG